MKSFSEHRIISQAKINVYKKINQQKITLKKIQKYFNKHKSSFFHSEKLKINYIKLDINKFKTLVNNYKLKKWYIQHHKKHLIPEKRKFTIIKTTSKKKDTTILTSLLPVKSFDKIEKKRKKIINYIPVAEKK